MYRIIGGDGQEYGPVSAEQVRDWIAQGRLNAHSQIRADDAPDWQALGAVPEFADAVGAQPPPAFAVASTAGPEAVGEEDYDLDVMGCISGGWQLLQANFGLLFGATLVYGAIILALAVLGAIPIIGAIFSIVSFVIGGPLIGGLFYVFIAANRGQPTAVGDLFIGFRTNFGQLFLGQLVTSLLSGLCVLPALIALAVGMVPAIVQKHDPSPAVFITFGVLLVLGLIPLIFITTNWLFTLPLIIDRRLDFWTAMKTSWRQVMRHWGSVFALLILSGLINFAGILACGVGVMFTAPIVIGAMVLAYETIFRAARLPAR
jgi:uncharacterized membrane protein